MSKDINLYPDTLETALDVYTRVRNDLVVDESLNSVESIIGEFSDLIYPSMVLANEFYKFYITLMSEGEE